MTYDNNFFPNGIEDLPPSGIDAVSRSRITGYTPSDPNVIDTGTEQLESPTVRDIMAQREDNPFLRLGVIGGVTGVICLFLWGIFAFLSPDTPIEVVEEVEAEETVEAEPDYKAQLAFRDQFYSLEKKPEPQTELETNELPPATKPELLPSSKPAVQPVPPRPIPQPATPRPVPRPTYRPAPKSVARLPQPVPAVTKPEVPPQEQWLALANFGTGVLSRSITQSSVRHPNNSPANPTPALLVNNSVSQGELGILNRRRIKSKVDRLTPAVTIDRGIVKGKIELPLVWDSSLAPEQQQSKQITVVLEEDYTDINEEE